ncbi:MAG: PIG-L family deacetylase, partial [Gemmatimonadetes bacterium]|nr:PIG-L family deacetylase [Gemmatimonadota bacterium]
MRSPSATASAPPGMKSGCMSTTSSAACAPAGPTGSPAMCRHLRSRPLLKIAGPAPGLQPARLAWRGHGSNLRAMTASKTRAPALALALLVASGAPAAAQTQTQTQTRTAAALAPAADAILVPATEYQGAAALGLALRRLGPTGRVLLIAAHPDDEDTQLLARLALGEGVDVAYLSLTRGEGGQNAIGPDFQEALGIIRTEELLAARRADGALQFFGREYDYGFSKSAEEAFQHWPRDSMLADVVRSIRRFRPDVIVSVFGGTARDGHGQHQAAGIIAKEGFAAAADPNRFPEQGRAGLVPWQARKLYEGGFFRQDSTSTRYATGEIDPLLGRSYAEIAVISRGRHQSQSVGRALPAGPRFSGVNLVDTRGVPLRRPEHGIFQGLDTTLSARATTALGAAAPATRLLAAFDSGAA